MLGITRREEDKLINSISKANVIETANWRWVVTHRWKASILHWITRDKKQPRKRPNSRYIDEINAFQRLHGWTAAGETFIQQGIKNG